MTVAAAASLVIALLAYISSVRYDLKKKYNCYSVKEKMNG